MPGHFSDGLPMPARGGRYSWHRRRISPGVLTQQTKGNERFIMSEATETLALFGGPKAVQTEMGDIIDWPIVTDEDEEAM